MYTPEPADGPYPPEYFMQMCAAGEATDNMYPAYSPTWLKDLLRHLDVRPGVQLKPTAPDPAISSLLASPVVQKLVKDELQELEWAHIVYDVGDGDGVDSMVLEALHDLVFSKFNASVDDALHFGVRFPKNYEEPLRAMIVPKRVYATTLFRWPPKRSDDNGDATVPFPITALTASVAAAVCHNLGVSRFNKLLSNDFAGLARPEPLWQFYSHRRHSICSRPQRNAVRTLLLVGLRLEREKGPAARLPALPREVWLRLILSFMQIADLGPFFEI